jgi:hypothetical protein
MEFTISFKVDPKAYESYTNLLGKLVDVFGPTGVLFLQQMMAKANATVVTPPAAEPPKGSSSGENNG